MENRGGQGSRKMAYLKVGLHNRDVYYQNTLGVSKSKYFGGFHWEIYFPD
jgi:hypothetical protein